MNSSIIVAERLTKWFGRRLAVDEVSLAVSAGEVMGLLGPNGSGKTTILRILTGYLCPSAGTARIAGLDVVDEALTARQRVGYVPEDAPVYDAMRVEEFLAFMARSKGLAGREVTRAIDYAVERLALRPLRRVQIGKLSRGYRQRVAIAQAILNDPEVLILDEPTNGLDPRQIIEMRELIRSLAGTHTILVSSHILSEIAHIADRVAILLDGRLLAIHALRPNGQSQHVRLTVHGDAVDVRCRLESVTGVKRVVLERVSGDAGTYIVEAEGTDVAERLAAAVTSGGFRLRALGEVSADLEAVFLDLTGGRPAGPR